MVVFIIAIILQYLIYFLIFMEFIKVEVRQLYLLLDFNFVMEAYFNLKNLSIKSNQLLKAFIIRDYLD